MISKELREFSIRKTSFALFAAALTGCGPPAESTITLRWGIPNCDPEVLVAGIDETATVTIWIKNEARTSVKFLRGGASCTCVSLAIPKGELKSGASTDLTMQVRVGEGTDHEIRVGAWLEYEGQGQNHVKQLSIAIPRRPQFDAKPRVVELRKTRERDARYTGSVTLTQYTRLGSAFREPVHISRDGPLSLRNALDWKELPSKGPFRQRECVVTLSAQPDGAGAGSGRLALQPDLAYKYGLSIPVFWQDETPIRVTPSTVIIRTATFEKEVVVESTSAPFSILEINGPQFLSFRALSPSESGRSRRIEIKSAAPMPSGKMTTEQFVIKATIGNRIYSLTGTLLILPPKT